MQKASVGRIVHYVGSSYYHLAAIITFVHHDYLVDLYIFPCARGGNEDGWSEYSVNLVAVASYGTCHWPEREE